MRQFCLWKMSDEIGYNTGHSFLEA
jgi:hypothetical protein